MNARHRYRYHGLIMKEPFTQPFIVVDQNRLRDAQVLHAALDRCCREKLRLLVPDGAFYEMSKGAKPFDTWRRSLKVLSSYRELVDIAGKMTDLMKAELNDSRPCKNLVSADATRFVRRLLGEIDAGDLDSLAAIVDGPLRQQLPASNAVWSDSAKHLADLQRTRDLLKRWIPLDVLKQLRQSPTESIPLWLSSTDGVRFVFQGLRHQGASETTALRLCSQPSVSGSFIAAMAGLALYWLAFGGLDAASADKVTNDFHDLEYSALASLCRDLLTGDARLACIHSAVKIAVEGRAEWYARALVRGAGPGQS